MNDLVQLDYLNDHYKVPESDSNAANNLLCTTKISKLLDTGGGYITCACGRRFNVIITGRNIGRLIDGSCDNPRCEYFKKDYQTKLYQYWPSNILPVYITLSNDTGYKGKGPFKYYVTLFLK